MRYAITMSNNGVMTATRTVPNESDEELDERLLDNVDVSSAYTKLGEKIVDSITGFIINMVT